MKLNEIIREPKIDLSVPFSIAMALYKGGLTPEQLAEKYNEEFKRLKIKVYNQYKHEIDSYVDNADSPYSPINFIPKDHPYYWVIGSIIRELLEGGSINKKYKDFKIHIYNIIKNGTPPNYGDISGLTLKKFAIKVGAPIKKYYSRGGSCELMYDSKYIWKQWEDAPNKQQIIDFLTFMYHKYNTKIVIQKYSIRFMSRESPTKFIMKEIKDYLHGGRADNLSLTDLAKKYSSNNNKLKKEMTPELEMGIKHEMEHTNDSKIAREIAMDHLAEDPQYYSHLKQKGIDEIQRMKELAGLNEIALKFKDFFKRHQKELIKSILDDIDEKKNTRFGPGAHEELTTPEITDIDNVYIEFGDANNWLADGELEPPSSMDGCNLVSISQNKEDSQSCKGLYLVDGISADRLNDINSGLEFIDFIFKDRTLAYWIVYC